MDNKELVSVTFVASASPYHEGDVAGFPEAEAKAYVVKEVARYTSAAPTSASDDGGLAVVGQGQASGAARTRKPKSASAHKDVGANGDGLAGVDGGQTGHVPEDTGGELDEADLRLNEVGQDGAGQEGGDGRAPADQE